MTAGPATYVFCLAAGRRPPALGGLKDTIPAAGRPRVVPIDAGLWAIVADAPLEYYDAERLRQRLQDVDAISRHALAHARVVEFVFQRAPVIPLKLFTLFSSDQSAAQQMRGRRRSLKGLFAKLRGLEEWGVRITAGQETADAARAASSGREYLRARRDVLAMGASPSPAVMKQAAAALRSLKRHASNMKKDDLPPPGPGRPFVVGASYLVRRSRRAKWRRAVTQVASALAAGGHRLDVSGPWPPYRFAGR